MDYKEPFVMGLPIGSGSCLGYHGFTPQLGHADEVKQNIILTILFLILIYSRLAESVTI